MTIVSKQSPTKSSHEIFNRSENIDEILIISIYFARRMIKGRDCKYENERANILTMLNLVSIFKDLIEIIA